MCFCPHLLSSCSSILAFLLSHRAALLVFIFCKSVGLQHDFTMRIHAMPGTSSRFTSEVPSSTLLKAHVRMQRQQSPWCCRMGSPAQLQNAAYISIPIIGIIFEITGTEIDTSYHGNLMKSGIHGYHGHTGHTSS